jgi:hypothetical protein
VVEPRTGRHEEKRCEMARYWKGKLVGRKKKRDTFSISACKVQIVVESNHHCHHCYHYVCSVALATVIPTPPTVNTTITTTATVNTTICTTCTATGCTVTASTSIAFAIKLHHCYYLQLRCIHVFNSVLHGPIPSFSCRERRQLELEVI